MTEEELEARRKEAAICIQRFVISTLELCRTQDEIETALIYFGTCTGKTLKAINPEQMRDALSRY